MYTLPSPNGIFIDTLEPNFVLPPVISVRVVQIGKEKDFGIAVQVDSEFIMKHGSEWLQKQCPTIWINVSRQRVQFCKPHEWSDQVEKSSSDDYHEPKRTDDSSEEEKETHEDNKVPSDDGDQVVHHDWYTLPAKRIKAYSEYSKCAAGPLRHWNLHDAWTGAVPWFIFARKYIQHCRKWQLDVTELDVYPFYHDHWLFNKKEQTKHGTELIHFFKMMASITHSTSEQS